MKTYKQQESKKFKDIGSFEKKMNNQSNDNCSFNSPRDDEILVFELEMESEEGKSNCGGYHKVTLNEEFSPDQKSRSFKDSKFIKRDEMINSQYFKDNSEIFESPKYPTKKIYKGKSLKFNNQTIDFKWTASNLDFLKSGTENSIGLGDGENPLIFKKKSKKENMSESHYTNFSNMNFFSFNQSEMNKLDESLKNSNDNNNSSYDKEINKLEESLQDSNDYNYNKEKNNISLNLFKDDSIYEDNNIRDDYDDDYDEFMEIDRESTDEFNYGDSSLPSDKILELKRKRTIKSMRHVEINSKSK